MLLKCRVLKSFEDIKKGEILDCVKGKDCEDAKNWYKLFHKSGWYAFPADMIEIIIDK